MIITTTFRDHWKLKELKRLSGRQDAAEMLLGLWGSCQERKTDRFIASKPTVIASFCRYDGDPVEFVNWLIECQILDTEGSDLVVHGWSDYNGTLISNWRNGQRGGRPAGAISPTGRSKEEKTTHSSTTGKNGKSPELPEDLRTPELQEAWHTWVQHRSEIHHKLMPTAARKQIKQIRELGPDRAIAAIRHSIANGYQGLFEPHQKPAGSSKPANKYKSEI